MAVGHFQELPHQDASLAVACPGVAFQEVASLQAVASHPVYARMDMAEAEKVEVVHMGTSEVGCTVGCAAFQEEGARVEA